MTQPQTWQESLNPQLAQRLIRPLVQPGVINSQIARDIIERSQRFTNRLPLLANRHGSSVTSLQSGQTPIVYAQPQPPVTPTDSRQEVPNSPSLETGNLPVIQAKLASNPTKQADKSGTGQQDNIVYAQPQLPVTYTDSRQEVPNSPSLETGNLPVVQAKLVSNTQSGGASHQLANNSPTVPSGYSITKRGNRERTTGNRVGKRRGFDPDLAQPPIQAVERNRYSQVVVVPERTEAPALPTPLVFSKMTTDVRPEANGTKGAAADSNQTRQRMPGAGGQGGFSTQGLQAQNYPEAIANPSPTGKPLPVAQVDVEAIANQVERKLMRRLVVESERRGKKRWP